MCGDSYAGVRHHEIGGKYATNTIVRHYLAGASIDVKILVRERPLLRYRCLDERAMIHLLVIGQS